MVSTAKTEKLNSLFNEWEEHYTRHGIDSGKFSSDGVISEPDYEAAPKKVLFVLRETNDYPKGDIRELLSNGAYGNIFHQLAKWAWGILNDFPKFEEVDFSPEMLANTIRKIAVMNLKKYTGGRIADFNLLHVFAFLDRDFIRREIEIIAPELIICCNTFIELMWALYLDAIEQNMHDLSSLFSKAYDYGESKIVVFLHHPADRRKHSDNYQELHNVFINLGL